MHSPPGLTAQTLTRQSVSIWGGRSPLDGSRGDVLTLDLFFSNNHIYQSSSLQA